MKLITNFAVVVAVFAAFVTVQVGAVECPPGCNIKPPPGCHKCYGL